MTGLSYLARLLLDVLAGALAVVATGCSSGDASTASGDGGTSTSAAGDATGLVVNEMNVVGTTEWLELSNAGSASIDIGNYALADTDKTTNVAKVADAMRFPTGTVLEAGAHLVVLLSKKDQSVGPYPKESCLVGATAPCFYATFGVSASTGESVHILKPDNSLLTSVAYPKALAPVAASNQSVCRLPDTTGDFAVCAATPGATNAGL